jgi:hypothetical protein
MFDKHIFDSYLHFTSPEDEAGYRRHEAAAQKYTNDQLARGTPEGNLNAGGGMLGQMLDADLHGAGNSPQFLPRWNALVAKTSQQCAAMHTTGQTTEEFDRHVATSVRSFLKAKGLSDAEIDKRLAASANPLDAVKPVLADDHAVRSPEGQRERAASPATTPPSLSRGEVSAATAPPDAPRAIDPDTMNAKLQGAVLQATDVPEATGHGLTVQKPASKIGQSIGA